MAIIERVFLRSLVLALLIFIPACARSVTTPVHEETSFTQDVRMDGALFTQQGTPLPRTFRLWKAGHQLKRGVCVTPLALGLAFDTRMNCRAAVDSYDLATAYAVAAELDASGRFVTWFKTAMNTNAIVGVDMLDNRSTDAWLRRLVSETALRMDSSATSNTSVTLSAGAGLDAHKFSNDIAFEFKHLPQQYTNFKRESFFDPYHTRAVPGCRMAIVVDGFTCQLALQESFCSQRRPATSAGASSLCLSPLGTGEMLWLFDAPKGFLTRVTIRECGSFAAVAQLQCHHGYQRMTWNQVQNAWGSVFSTKSP